MGGDRKAGVGLDVEGCLAMAKNSNENGGVAVEFFSPASSMECPVALLVQQQHENSQEVNCTWY